MNMRYADIFAGLGGFHHGLSNAKGFECVFASEIDTNLRKLYETNYGLMPEGDITKIHVSNIPDHSLLCAGFPCQPFSLAGAQKGTKCPESGKLINDVIRIAKHKRPNFLILENVPNVLTIADGTFWKYIKTSFEKLGYKLIHKVISPEQIGIPQNRKRLFIVGSLDHELLSEFKWPRERKVNPLNNIIDETSKYDYLKLNNEKNNQLVHWQNLLNNCSIKHIPSISLCAPEFGANYPVNFKSLRMKDMTKYRGSYGQSLKNCKTWKQLLEKLPSYTRKNKCVPEWIQESVEFSREFYKQNKRYLDKWHKTLNKENNSWQVLEWRGYSDYFNFDRHLLQFRASGIRVIKTIRAPSLIAMTPTQIPIIGSQMRYMSKHEAAKLQNLHRIKSFPESEAKAFKAFGNAVNAKIVELIGKRLKQIM